MLPLIRFAIITGILVSFLAFSTPSSEAGSRDNPPPLPGWTHTERFRDDSPQQHGVILSGADVVRSSPTIANIDGNATNGQEVAVGGTDGMLYVYTAKGQLLWSTHVMPNPACVGSRGQWLNSKPAVGELYGDGRSYVVVGYGTANSDSPCDGGIAAYDGLTGRLAWRFSLSDWAKRAGYAERRNGVTSSPALADTDNDGRMEIGFGGFDRNIYLLNADGSVRWYYHAADTIWSSPSFVNVDSDPELEMVIGSDITANLDINPPTANGGYVYAFDTQSIEPKRVDFRDPEQLITVWRTDLDQAIYSSPSIADIIQDSPGLELVIGASCSHPVDGTNKRGKWIKILRLSDGVVLQTLNARTCVQSSPALGDLDDDGELEVVATVMGAERVGGDGKSRIMAWDVDNPTPRWQHVPGDPNSGSNDPYGGDLQSTVIADLDGNGSLEVLYANYWSVGVLNGRDGKPLTCQSKSCGSQLSLYGWKTVKSTPAVGDINQDGKLDVVIGGGHVYADGRGILYAWTDFAGLLNSPPGSQPAYSAPWPQFRSNAHNTGLMVMPPEKPKPKLPSTINMLVAQEGPFQIRQYTLPFTMSDGSSFNWTVTLNGNVADLVTLNQTSGSGEDKLKMTINGENVPPGSYTGSMTVQATDSDLMIQIPMSVEVAEEVMSMFMPLVIH